MTVPIQICTLIVDCVCAFILLQRSQLGTGSGLVKHTFMGHILLHCLRLLVHLGAASAAKLDVNEPLTDPTLTFIHHLKWKDIQVKSLTDVHSFATNYFGHR